MSNFEARILVLSVFTFCESDVVSGQEQCELCASRAQSYLKESVVLLQSFDVKTSLLSKSE